MMSISVFKQQRMVNKYWFHILINAFTVLLGFITFLPLSNIINLFSGQCLLYADVRLQATGSGIHVNQKQTTWGDDSTCNMSVYFAVVTTIHAFIWCWFFLMLIFQPSNEVQEIFLLDISFITHLAISLMLLVSSGKLTGGTRQWCDQLTSELDRIGLSQNISSCAATERFTWNILKGKHRYYSFLLTSNICSWFLTVTVLFQSYWCAYRLFKWNEDTGTDNKPVNSSSKDDGQTTYKCYTNEALDDGL